MLSIPAAVPPVEKYRIAGRTPAEMGASAARSHGAAVRHAVRVLARLSRRHDLLDSVNGGGRRLLSRHDERGRGIASELRGMAGALSVSVEDLACARVLIESIAVTGCSNFGAVAPSTADGNPLVSWNFDASYALRLLMGKFPLYVRDMAGTNPYVCLGVPALFGIGILNAEGLTSVVNAVGLQDDGEGLSPFELNNVAMENCSTVDGAAEVFERGPREAIKAKMIGMLLNWNTIWADLGGSLSVFESSHNHFRRERAGEGGVVASTNHHQFLDRSLSGSFDPTTQEIISGSYSRLARMWALIRGHHGSLDPAVAKRIISDHVPDYALLAEFGIKREWWEKKVDNATICAHAWNMRSHLLAGELTAAFDELDFSTTLYSMQIQPAAMTVWLTCGHPCRNMTTPVSWGRALGTGTPADAALSPEAAGRLRRSTVPRGIFRTGAGTLERLLARTWYGITRVWESHYFKVED